MIRVIDRFYAEKAAPDQLIITVDADDAIILNGDSVGGTCLVLLKGEEEVAWFDSWTSAIRVENLNAIETKNLKEG